MIQGFNSSLDSNEAPLTHSVAGLRWIDFELRPNSHLRSHSHGTPHLCIIQKGHFQERDGVAYHHCKKDTARLSRAGINHELFTEKEAPSGKMIELLPGWGYNDQRFWKNEQANVYLSIENDRVLQDLMAILDELGSFSTRPFLLVRQLLANHAFSDYQRPSWYDDVRTFLDRNYLEPSLPVRIANETGLHRTHFARQFFRAFGCSVQEYTRVQRLDYAARLIRKDKLPLSAIAHECRFSDQSHLTRSFKRYFGQTPGAYKRMVLSSQSKA